MSVLKTQCPACSRRLKVPESACGRRIRCVACGHTFILPLSAPPRDVPTPPSAERDASSRRLLTPARPTILAATALGLIVVGVVAVLVVSPPTLPEVVHNVEAPVANAAPVSAKPDALDADALVVPDASSRPIQLATATPPAPGPRVEPEIERVTPAAPEVAPVKEPAADVEDPVEKALRSVVLVRTETGLGTGFLYSAPNIVVTNFHVIDGAKEATAVFFDGTSTRVVGFRLAALDYDFAVLELEKGHDAATPLKACKTRPSRGTDVYALGSPSGLAGTVTKGIVSAYRSWPEIVKSLDFSDSDGSPSFAPDSHWIQTSAPISSGNSGGPLITPLGEVVAVNTWVLTTGQNLNFSLDFARVAKVVDVGLGKTHPLAALPKGTAFARTVDGSGVTSENAGAIKEFWTALSKIMTAYRQDLDKGPPLVDGVAGLKSSHTQTEWTKHVLRATSQSLEKLPSRDIPEPVLEFAVALASRMRRAHASYASIIDLEGKPTDRQSEFHLLRERFSAMRLMAEIDALIRDVAPMFRRELEKRLDAELPPLSATR